MKLTPNFSSEEFVVSAQHKALVTEILASITPLDEYKFFLLARMILQPIRDYIDMPIQINSGKRSEALNKAIGGATNSDHLYREECAAVDFTLNDTIKTQKAFIWLLNKPYLYGQLISYPDKNDRETFLHISLPSKAHHGERLRKVNGKFGKI